jgi:hypothetical protein
MISFLKLRKKREIFISLFMFFYQSNLYATLSITQLSFCLSALVSLDDVAAGLVCSPPVNELVTNLTPIIIGESKFRSNPAHKETLPVMPVKFFSTGVPPKELVDVCFAFLNTEI